MLVLKKISIKKLTVYVSIIILMLGSIGFILYRNRTLTGRQPLAIDNPAQLGNQTAVFGDQAALNQVLADPLKTDMNSSQPLGASKINNQGIDLTIFSNEKFKDLEENILIHQADQVLGKRDLFKPN